MSREKQWVIPQPILIPEDYQSTIGGHPLVAQTLYQRGYRTIAAAQAFLSLDDYQPTPPDELPDLEIACNLLSEAIENGRQILVWGDFDVDGQTATTTLVEGLRELGGSVSYHIPVRAKESHGITRSTLETYLDQGFDLLLTCDTGISEHENIAFVRQAGKPVIVTDHHTLGESLPQANAVVNPQRLPEDHPLRTLPGVGVAYKLIEALFEAFGHAFDSGRYSELTALGIVADVANLKGDTRYLLQKGLLSLRRTQRLGLKTLYHYAGLNPLHINEEHIGFQIAPRLNAIGRLGDANPMVDFLTTTDAGRARVLAAQIEAMNAKRRFTTRQVEKAAESQLQSSSKDRLAPAIVLHHPTWPGGVVGIVASRLVERYQKPALLLTGEDPIHGSARSIEGLNITKAISSQAELLTSYGGHPMAAGLSLPASAYPAFKRGFLSEVEEKIKHLISLPELKLAQALRLDEVNLNLIEQIQRLSPFGSGNPPLYFLIRDLTLISAASVGSQGEHRQVIAADRDENQQRFIWWNGGDEPLPEAPFDLVCRLSLSDYKGDLQISAEWIDFHLSENVSRSSTRQELEWIDHRDTVSPIPILQDILEQNPAAQIWGKEQLPDEVRGLNRHELGMSDTLIIWTTPPSLSVFQDVVRRVSPRQVILFCLPLTPKSHDDLLTQIAGLAKYAIHQKNGEALINIFASVCDTDQEAVRVGLQLWEAKGKLNVTFSGEDLKIKAMDSSPDQQIVEILTGLFSDIITETQAFRRFFRLGDIDSLVH